MPQRVVLIKNTAKNHCLSGVLDRSKIVPAIGYVHRLVEHSKGEFSDKRGTHINGLEGFWGYPKKHLASKGGIRRERLPLYLAECVWHFSHRKYSGNEQVTKLFKMLYNYKQIHKSYWLE